MKSKKIVVMLAAVTAFVSMAVPAAARAAAAELRVLATTFPIYQIVRNVTRGRDGLQVSLMLPARMGCPHDYALNPQDMQKLAAAAILVINGLGLEAFAGTPVQKANPRITVIDSSAGIGDILYDRDARGHARAHAEEENRGSPNPHLFAGPRMHARIAQNIAAGLSRADPDGAAVYASNARSYAETITRLADDMAALGRRLRNNRIVQPHGVFDYLARDMGLKIVAVMQYHGQEPPAAAMVSLVKTIRERRPGAVFTEPQYPEKIGRTLSQETGVPFAMLDPAATGPEDAPLDYYEKLMRGNMLTIEQTLGARQP